MSEDLKSLAEEIRRKAVDWTINDLRVKQGAIASVGSQSDSGGQAGAVANAEQVVQQLRPGVEAEFAVIPGLYADFDPMPTAAGFDAAIVKMTDVLAKLSNGDTYTKNRADGNVHIRPAGMVIPDHYDKVKHDVEDWTGEAARNFTEKFVYPLKDTVRNEYLVACSLKGALDAERAIWDGVNKDIFDIAHKTLAALDNLDVACAAHAGQFLFNTGAVVAAIVGAPLGDGPAVGVAIVGVLSSTGASLIPDPPQMEYGGGDAYTIVQDMRDAITRLKAYINEGERGIAQALLETSATVSSPPNADAFTLTRPELVGVQPDNVKSLMGYST